ERLLLSDLSFNAPGTALEGNLTRYADGFLEGRLTLDAPNIETAAALALVEASGTAQADIVLTRSGDAQNAELTAGLDGVTFGDIVIGSADAQMTVADAFGVPVVDGSITGS